MPETLEATLVLDYADALSTVEDLRSKVEEAFSDVTLGLDTSALDDLTGTSVEIPVEADTVPAVENIQAIPDAAPDVEVPVDADTGGAVAEIREIPNEAPEVQVPVTIDTTGVEAQLDSITGHEIIVPVDVETGDAAAQVDEVGDSLLDAGGKADTAKGGLDGVSTAFTGIGAVSGAAQGRLGGVTGALEALGPGGAVAGAGILATAGALGTMFVAGEKSVAANERLKIVFGDLTSSVQHIDIGGLNGDLGELATKAGSSGAALKQAVANLGQLATASGKSKQEAAGFTEQVSALSLRAVALNPALGDAGQVADRMGAALARGGRFAARFGLDLTTTEINARALADTGKTATKELTQVEKSMAGAQIATEKLGGAIGTDFNAGVEQSAVQLKRLQREIADAFAQAGAPLVAPLIDALHSIVPAVAEVSGALGQIGAAAVIPIGQVADILGGLPGPLLAAAAGLGAVYAITTKVAGVGGLQGVGFGAQLLAESFRKAAPAIGAAGLAVGIMGVASGNATETVLGFATAGLAAGTAIGGIAGPIGAVAGAGLGLGLALFGPTHSMSDLEVASSRLSKTVKSGSIPAMYEQIEALGKAATANAAVSVDVGNVTDAQKKQAEALGGTRDAYIAVVAETEFAKESAKAFNVALHEGPGQAAGFIQAMQQAGRETGTFQLALDLGAQAQEKLAIANAQATTSINPLRASFEESATAVGELGIKTFDTINAVNNMASAQAASESATAKFNETLKTGTPVQVAAAAAAAATAESQSQFTTAIAEGKTAQEAGTAGLEAYRAKLESLRDAAPTEELKGAISSLIADVDARLAEPRTMKVAVDDSAAIVGLSALQAEAQRIIQGKPVQLDVLTRGFPEAEGQLDRLKGRGDLLKDPVFMTTILQDLASGDLGKLTADLDAVDGKTVEPTVTATVLGEDDVNGLVATMEATPNVDRNVYAHSLGYEDVGALAAAMLAVPNVDRNTVAHALGFSDIAALEAAMNIPDTFADVVASGVDKYSALVQAARALNGSILATATVIVKSSGATGNASVGDGTFQGGPPRRAAGGPIPGYQGGGGTTDPHAGGFLARLHPGEFVLSADVVRRIKAGAPSFGAIGENAAGSGLNHAADALNAAAARLGQGATGRPQIFIVPLDDVLRRYPELRSMDAGFLGGRG